MILKTLRLAYFPICSHQVLSTSQSGSYISFQPTVLESALSSRRNVFNKNKETIGYIFGGSLMTLEN